VWLGAHEVAHHVRLVLDLDGTASSHPKGSPDIVCYELQAEVRGSRNPKGGPGQDRDHFAAPDREWAFRRGRRPRSPLSDVGRGWPPRPTEGQDTMGALKHLPSRARLAVALAALSLLPLTIFLAHLGHDRLRVRTYTVATSGRTSKVYTLGELFADAVADRSPQIRLRILETTGSSESMQLVQDGRADLAIVQSDIPAGPSVRSVMLLFPQLYHLVAAEGSGIEHVEDIRGKRVATSLPGAGSHATLLQLLRHYGMTSADLRLSAISTDEGTRAFLRGDVDAVFRNTQIGQEQMRELLSTGRARLIPFDQADAMRLSQPLLEAFTIPRGTYRPAPAVPDGDTPTVGVSTMLVARESTDPAVVREITRILFEQRSALALGEPLAAVMANPSDGNRVGLAVHPGAQSYYDREKPSFLVTYAEPMGFVLTVALLVGSWIWSLRTYLAQRGRARVDRYSREILRLTQRALDSDELPALDAVRGRLSTILNEVEGHLEHDRMPAEALQAFSVPWELAMGTVCHREFVARTVPRPGRSVTDSPPEPIALVGRTARDLLTK